MRFRAIAFAAFVSLTSLSAAHAADAVAYRVMPVLVSGQLSSLDVEMRFTADPSGRTLLELPDHAGPDKDIWKYFGAVSADGATVEQLSPAERILLSQPNQKLTIRYRVTGAYDHDPSVMDDSWYRPILRPAWFEVLGSRIFATPKGRDAAPATFAWGPVPAGWRVASSLDKRADLIVGTTQDSVMIGGSALEVLESHGADGGRLRLASIGGWQFSTADLLAAVAKVSDAEDAFWGDGGQPYLVTMIPLAPANGAHASGGRGLSKAFALYEEPTAKLEDFPFLLAHERMHGWIPRGLGGIPEDGQIAYYWFSEGFTDVYAARMLLRSGAWVLEDLVRNENDLLVRYAGSTARNATNAEIARDFWSDDAISQTVYDRGRLLATIWDYRLRHDSHGKLGLDDVLLAEHAAARRKDPDGTKGTATADFAAIYARMDGASLDADTARYIDAGATVALPPNLYGDCATVSTIRIPVYDVGFDRAQTRRTHVFTGVRKDSPAYAAGLRDGMTAIDRLDRNTSDSRVEIGYRVSDDRGAERTIRYLPAGKVTMEVQQIDLPKTLSPDDRRRCARRMSGKDGAM